MEEGRGGVGGGGGTTGLHEEDSEDTEGSLERELEVQLVEHKDSLAALTAAIQVEPSEELLQVQAELEEACRSAEQSLLHLKRARLLKECAEMTEGVAGADDEPADAAGGSSNAANPKDIHTKGHATETLPLSSEVGNADREAAADRIEAKIDKAETVCRARNFTRGSKCQFLHADGRWYAGEVLWSGEVTAEALRDIGHGSAGNSEPGSSFARVRFLHPSKESVQTCRFFLQGNCRFDNNCRFSHGTLIPANSLREFGSSTGSLQDLRLGKSVAGSDDGDCNSYDDGSEEEEDDDDEEEEEEEEEEEWEEGEENGEVDEEWERNTGLGNLFEEAAAMAEAGPQNEVVNFVDWEQHTRGIASKMMAKMGYQEGMGLGKLGQGIQVPLPVRVLPAKRGLDYVASKLPEAKEAKRKKRKRGGEKVQRRKAALAAKQRELEQERSDGDMFALINRQLHSSSATVSTQDAAANDSKGAAAAKTGKAVDRKSLLLKVDQVRELKETIGKLEEMLERNKNEKPVYVAVQKKLEHARCALAQANAAHNSVRDILNEKDAHKKWLKF